MHTSTEPVDDAQLKGEHIERLRRELGVWEVWLRCAAEAIQAGDTDEAQRQIRNVRTWMRTEHQA